jgi:hydrogenase-4 membrane subunit HyfE
VLDELREELPFVDLENGAVRVVTINLDGVPVNVEVKPTVDSVTLTIVGAF